MQRGGETALIKFGVFLAWWGEGLNFVIRFSFIKRAVLPTAIFKIPFDSAVSVFLILPLLIFSASISTYLCLCSTESIFRKVRGNSPQES